jgi:hypothetical protein
VPPFKRAECELLSAAEFISQAFLSVGTVRDDQCTISQFLAELVEEAAQRVMSKILIG